MKAEIGVNREAVKADNITAALKIIARHSTNFSPQEVFGLMIFGSFWEATNPRLPQDIDIAVYCDNDASVRDDLKSMTDELQAKFGIPVEVHPLTKQAAMIRRQIADYQTYLKEGRLIWGTAPTWLELPSLKLAV